MPVHNHTASSSDSGHTHSWPGSNNIGTNNVAASGGPDALVEGSGFSHATGSGTANITTTIGNAGSGDAHTILSPAIIFNKIIYAGT
jgi:microcystin-dependent protein